MNGNEISGEKQARAARILALAGVLLGASLAFAPAQAATVKEVQIAGRVLGFMLPPLSGDVKIGIVYDPSIPDSVADEQSLITILGPGLQIGEINLIPVPVSLANVASTQVGILYLTHGLGAEAAKVGAQAEMSKILCLTTDLSATQAGDCTVAVQSDQSVVITVNKAAAGASGISFGSVFLLMVSVI